MPLFRFHRGGLEESLKTTVIVKNKVELGGHILNNAGLLLNAVDGDTVEIELKIEPYIDKDNNFDARIGWYTHIVMLSINKQPFHPAGFLSEPMEDSDV